MQIERGNAAIDSVSGVRGPGRAHHVVREGIAGGGRLVRYRATRLIEEPGARPVIQSREHWWRFLVLAVGTASREAALLS